MPKHGIHLMKQLYSSPDSAQVALIRSILDAANVPFEVRNEAVSQAIPPFSSEIWVQDDDFEDANRLIKESHPA